MNRTACSLIAIVAWLAAAPDSKADAVRLVNGDVVRGKVLSLDQKELKLQSELLGTLAIPREKVQWIGLGDAALVEPAAAATKPSGNSPAPDAVDDHLKSKGIDPKAFRQINPAMLQQLEQAFPLLGVPEVQKYFNETVSGLSSGRTGIDDIRKDAIKARDQMEELQKDLGPEAKAAFGPYMGILNRFLRETDPPKTNPEPQKPTNEGTKRK